MSTLLDVVSFIERINIITIIFFVFTLTLVVYEWILYRKSRLQPPPPQMPTFAADSQMPALSTASSHATPLSIDSNKPYGHRTQLIIVGIIILLSLSATIAGFFINKKEPPTEKVTTQSTGSPPPTTTSKGVAVYTPSWKSLTAGEIATLKPGDTIFLTIETTSPKENDKARLRVNEEVWLPEHETTLYNSVNRVYYQSYTLTPDYTELKIEAQLHSIAYGWPLTTN